MKMNTNERNYLEYYYVFLFIKMQNMYIKQNILRNGENDKLIK